MTEKIHRGSETAHQWNSMVLRVYDATPSFELEESAGGKLGRLHLAADGVLTLETNDGVGGGWIAAAGFGGGASSPMTLTSGSATEIPQTIVAHASQSDNLSEWKNSAGTVKLSVDADFQIVTTLDPNAGDYALTSGNKLGIQATNSIWLTAPSIALPGGCLFSASASGGAGFYMGNQTFTISGATKTISFGNAEIEMSGQRLRIKDAIGGNTSNDETARIHVYSHTATSSTSGTIAAIFNANVGVQTLTHDTIATTFTDASTLRIEGAPVAGANVTITNAWAVQVLSGASQFQDVMIGTEAVTRNKGELTQSAGSFSTAGDSQVRRLHLRRQTTDATPVILSDDNAHDSSGSWNCAYKTLQHYRVTVIGHRDDDSEFASFTLEGTVRRADSADPTSLWDTLESWVQSSAAWDAYMTVGSGGVKLYVVGEAAKNINWSASVELVESTVP